MEDLPTLKTIVMDIDESLTHVKRLLKLLPGVEIDWAQKSSTMIRLGLVISVPRSLSLLAHITCATNVPFHVEVDWKCAKAHDDPDCLRYDLRIPIESEPFDPPRRLQIFGGTLLQHLKDQSLIMPDEADNLLRAWNFYLE